MQSPQKDAVGVAIKARVIEDEAAVDVSTSSTKQIFLKKPDGTIVIKTAAFVTDGIDGWLQYVTVAGDLDASGTWEYQPYVVLPGGYDGRGARLSFEVRDNLS